MNSLKNSVLLKNEGFKNRDHRFANFDESYFLKSSIAKLFSIFHYRFSIFHFRNIKYNQTLTNHPHIGFDPVHIIKLQCQWEILCFFK